MGAYWHLALPLEICINNNEKSLEAFNSKYADDYVLKVNRKETEEVSLDNGSITTSTINENIYILSNDLFMREFKPIYKDLLSIYVDMFQEYKMPSILYKERIITDFFIALDELDLISIANSSEVLNQFSKKEGAYIMSYDGWVPQMVVYEGYPLNIEGEKSSMDFVTFFYSYFKIGEYHKEFGQIYHFYETVRKILSTKYQLVKYLALPGF